DELKISEKMVVENISSSGTTVADTNSSGTIVAAASSNTSEIDTTASTTACNNSNSKQESSSSVTVVKSTTITSVSSQESSSVQVVETTSTEVNHSTVNGTETKKKAPLAKCESFFLKEPKDGYGNCVPRRPRIQKELEEDNDNSDDGQIENNAKNDDS
ncbi:unnamed protein product, partial [Meganyctiphanes norvegica]